MTITSIHLQKIVYYKTETLYWLNNNSAPSSALSPWNQPCYFKWVETNSSHSLVRSLRLWFIYVVACVWMSFLFKAEKYSIVCIYHILSIYLLMNTCFLWPFNYWEIWIYKYPCPFFQVFLGISAEVELLDNTIIPFFIFWETALLFFHSGCAILYIGFLCVCYHL